MTFHQWARRAVPDTPPIGDFLDDWQHDRERPRQIKTCSALVSYLRFRSACEGAVDAARAAWKQYQRERRMANTPTGKSIE
jgi:YozE SAM-like fold